MERPEHGIAGWQACFSRGEWTAVGLCQAFLARIAAMTRRDRRSAR